MHSAAARVAVSPSASTNAAGLPVPPARLKLLSKVLLELYRDKDGVKAPAIRAPIIAELCSTLHDGVRPLRWVGDTKIREQAYALALGPRRAGLVTGPETLCAEMRPYQKEGVAWLQNLREHSAGGILADDMGLGKTLQTIAHILIEKEQGRLTQPAMVVTLTSLVGNWKREIERFAPTLKIAIHHGADRHIRQHELHKHHVIITTYPMVTRDRDELAKLPLHMLILDEAHAIKNHDAQAAEAVRALDAKNKVCLSGTPIENHLGELWSLFDFLNPGLLGTREEFTLQFRQPIEERSDKNRLEALRDRVRPYLLRRTKDSVAPELPAKTMLVRAIDLSADQRELYESIRVAAHADVRRHIKAKGMASSTIQILDALLKLRQVCCDPRLIKSDSAKGVEGSAKLTVLLDMVQSQLADGRRILIFSQFARMLALISEGLLGKGIGHVSLTGNTPDRQKPIDAFQQGRADVFLISLKAGGAGLNLVGADSVIHYDPWWNPASASAGDRSSPPHRPDQARVRPQPDHRGLRRGAHGSACSATRACSQARSSTRAARLLRSSASATSTICSRSALADAATKPKRERAPRRALCHLSVAVWPLTRALHEVLHLRVDRFHLRIGGALRHIHHVAGAFIMRSPYFFIIASPLALSPFWLSAHALRSFISPACLSTTGPTASAILVQSPLADLVALPMSSMMPMSCSALASSPPLQPTAPSPRAAYKRRVRCESSESPGSWCGLGPDACRAEQSQSSCPRRRLRNWPIRR